MIVVIFAYRQFSWLFWRYTRHLTRAGRSKPRLLIERRILPSQHYDYSIYIYIYDILYSYSIFIIYILWYNSIYIFIKYENEYEQYCIICYYNVTSILIIVYHMPYYMPYHIYIISTTHPMTPSCGSSTSPFPVNSKVFVLSATSNTASNLRRYLSVLQALANSTHALQLLFLHNCHIISVIVIFCSVLYVQCIYVLNVS